MQKKYKVIPVYFDETDKEQLNLYNKLRELTFKGKIESASSFLRGLAQKAVK